MGQLDIAASQPCANLPACGIQILPRGSALATSGLLGAHLPSALLTCHPGASFPRSLSLSRSLSPHPPSSPHSSYLNVPRAVDVGRVVARIVRTAKCPLGFT